MWRILEGRITLNLYSFRRYSVFCCWHFSRLFHLLSSIEIWNRISTSIRGISRHISILRSIVFSQVLWNYIFTGYYLNRIFMLHFNVALKRIKPKREAFLIHSKEYDWWFFMAVEIKTFEIKKAFMASWTNIRLWTGN